MLSMMPIASKSLYAEVTKREREGSKGSGHSDMMTSGKILTKREIVAAKKRHGQRQHEQHQQNTAAA